MRDKTKKMNKFQKSVLNDISEQGKKFELQSSINENGNEKLCINFTSFLLLLYPDGANIISNEIDIRFEIYDYNRIHDMRQDIVNKVIEIAGNFQ